MYFYRDATDDEDQHTLHFAIKAIWLDSRCNFARHNASKRFRRPVLQMIRWSGTPVVHHETMTLGTRYIADPTIHAELQTSPSIHRRPFRLPYIHHTYFIELRGHSCKPTHYAHEGPLYTSHPISISPDSNPKSTSHLIQTSPILASYPTPHRLPYPTLLASQTFPKPQPSNAALAPANPRSISLSHVLD